MPRFSPTIEQQTSSAGAWTSGGYIEQIGEDTPELRWPNSTVVYDRMRKDGKCASVLRAMTMPIRRTSWHVVDSPDVRPEVATFVRNNLGLVEVGASRQRRRTQGVSWDPVLQHSLLMLPFGHMFFEPVYTISPPGPGDVGLPAGQYAYLTRLAPILPRTISGFDIDDIGDLLTVKQYATRQGGKATDVTIAADRLIRVVNDREGSDWTGTSVFRAAYKHWFMKDQLERLAIMIVERNGMGIPTAEYGPDQDRTETLRMLTALRAGELSAAAMPQGMNLQLLGVTGSLVDPMPQIAYHSQEIARSLLAMFLDLGHDAGARSLGDTFVDFFTMAMNSVIADLEEIHTEQTVRQLVDLNFGEDEAYPEIAADEISPQSPLTAEAIGALLTAGALTPDESLEADVRRRFGLPPATPADADDTPPPEPDNTIDMPAGGSSHSGRTGATGATGSVARSGRLPDVESRLDRVRARLARR